MTNHHGGLVLLALAVVLALVVVWLILQGGR